MDNNLWGYLLEALSDLAQGVLDILPIHTDIGLVGLIDTTFGGTLQLIIALAGSFFNLNVFAFVLVTIITLETIRAIIAAYRWVASLIGDLPLVP